MLLRAAKFYSKDLIGSIFRWIFLSIKTDVVIPVNVVIHNDLYRIFFSFYHPSFIKEPGRYLLCHSNKQHHAVLILCVRWEADCVPCYLNEF